MVIASLVAHFPRAAAAALIGGALLWHPAQAQPRTGGASAQGGPVAGEIAGRYAILRKDDVDVGCLLTLRANGRAQLGPACGDHGIVVFDPVRWAFARNRLTLQARRGHRIAFARAQDGVWRRDPPAKIPLGLRKH